MSNQPEYQYVVLYEKFRNDAGRKEKSILSTYCLDEEGIYKVYAVDDDEEPEGFKLEPKRDLRLYNKILKLAGKDFRLVINNGQLEKKFCKPRNPLNPKRTDIEAGALENFVNGI